LTNTLQLVFAIYLDFYCNTSCKRFQIDFHLTDLKINPSSRCDCWANPFVVQCTGIWVDGGGGGAGGSGEEGGDGEEGGGAVGSC